eukprot:124331-Prymnesium_polylepis.1
MCARSAQWPTTTARTGCPCEARREGGRYYGAQVLRASASRSGTADELSTGYARRLRACSIDRRHRRRVEATM